MKTSINTGGEFYLADFGYFSMSVYTWKYAGRECTVKEENGKNRILIDSEVIEHDILPGTGRISRKKEHFEGLLKAVRDRNVRNYSIDVEKRDLRQYEEVE